MLTAFLVVFVFLAALLIFSSYYEYHGFGSREGVFRKAKTRLKTAALTFDDGPSREFTPRILDILKTKDVKATFFMTGQMVEAHANIAAQVVKDGHEVGNHTFSHFNMVFLRKEDLVREIERGEQVLAKMTGRPLQLIRPPRGLFNKRIKKELLKRGYTIVLWSVSAADWGPLGKRGVVWRVKHFAVPGAVVLFHDGGALVKNHGGNREATVYALPLVIDYLKELGYSLVTVSELMEIDHR